MYSLVYILNMFRQLIIGIPITLVFTISSWIIGITLSIFVTWGRLSKKKIISLPLNLLFSFDRSVPIVLQLFLVFYGLPVVVQLIFGININGINQLIFGIITFSIYYGLYLSEIFRSAYLSIKSEQHDAASSLGYSKLQTNIHIIIPQMFSITFPSLGNEIINLVHQSSILFTIGIVDIMGQANTIITTSYTSSPLFIYVCAGIIYWIITVIMTLFIKYFENRFSKFNQ